MRNPRWDDDTDDFASAVAALPQEHRDALLAELLRLGITRWPKDDGTDPADWWRDDIAG